MSALLLPMDIEDLLQRSINLLDKIHHVHWDVDDEVERKAVFERLTALLNAIRGIERTP